MGTLRANLPLRLRQLLSGEGTIGPSLKLESEPPPKIKAFIDRVIKTPFADIEIPLSSFRWEYNKGNFHHWRPLFLHFDTYFKAYLCSRKDLLVSDSISDGDELFPKLAILQILRIMKAILENCHNKSSFSGLEHFKLLLASTDPEILIAALETLSALVKINPSKLHVSGKLIGCGSLNNYLLSLAQGWGSKEEGLGLYSCVVTNERCKDEGIFLSPSDMENDSEKSQYRLASTLHFEFNLGTSPNSEKRQSSNLQVVHIPDLHLQADDDFTILKQLVDQYNVPQEQRFSLLTRIRYSHAFSSPETCWQYSKICLLSFIVLVQSTDAHEELVSFFANEPEFTNELIKLVRSVNGVPESIKTLAMLALGAQLAAYTSSHERARILSGSSIISAGGNRMVLLSVLQKAVLSLGTRDDQFSSVLFVDAILHFYLLHVISSSSSGSAIRGSGLVPALLPLLQDTDSSHMHLVCSAVKTLQKLMDYSNAAVSLFKDLGGVEFLVHRLQVEVKRVIDGSGENFNPTEIGDLLLIDNDHLYSQKRLIKALLKGLGSATYAPANSNRPQNSQDNSLPITLMLIFGAITKFGGDIYFSAVTVMSEIIHKDPTCFPVLSESGLPDAFLSSVVAGILPSSKALTCVSSGLGAICLNTKGLEAVKESNALRFLVDIFTTRKYLAAMNEAIVPLANAVEELLRHESSLRSTGVDIIIEILDKLTSLGEDSSSSSSWDGNAAMETDSEEKESGFTDPNSDGIGNERLVQLCIFHVMVLVHRTMENAETCRLFVEKKGIEAMMKLLLRPSISQSSEGMSIALHSTVVFKGFTQQHSAPLARAFCSSLGSHLKKALSVFDTVSGTFLLAPRSTPDSRIFSGFFVVEFLLFLAASRDNRWVTALLTEFGNGSKNVLEDIGRLHREVLWQIALLEDSKLEPESDICAPNGDSQKSDSSVISNDLEEQSLSSFQQFLDPLMRRRVSGWSSELFDLINLYRDLGRATGIQQRLGLDGASNMRFGSSSLILSNNSLDGPALISKTEGEKQRSYYSSCCDMMKSLSFHISHLFLELGKVMLLPSRRRDDSPNVSPSAKTVVSTFSCIILDHLNFRGHVDPCKSELSISTKCRYLGKVIEFVDTILLDRPDSCNPILVNCFYGHGVIKAMLTTFEATSQLLFFDVNRAPVSPMETDDGISKQEEKEGVDYSWIYGPLASYGLLMDHLVTASFIFSPFTKQLLVQPLTPGTEAFPGDAEIFVKVIQSKILKAVLPIWNHPQLFDCNSEFITSIISIMRHIYSGVEVKSSNTGNGAQITGPPPDESAISMIVEMGFSRSRAEEALRQVGANSVEMAMEWLFSHPEEVQEDDELARALAMSLGNSGASGKENMVAMPSNPEQEEEKVQIPPIDELLTTSIKLLQMKETLAFSVRDLLIMISSQNDGHFRAKVVTFIIDHLKQSFSISNRGNETVLSALFHVLALILHEDSASREIAAKNSLATVTLDILSQWDPSSYSGEKTRIPKWVTAAFLVIDRMLQVDPKLNPEILRDLGSQKSVLDENGPKNLPHTISYIDLIEQKKLIEIACNCIRGQLPAETMHMVLQLCATLTKVHSVAVSFLGAGGLPALLSLPTSSLFSGFDSVAAAIVRHVLEDPHTLQQAMESEIRHSLVAAINRHANGRLPPRNFLLNLASVISRDPAVFMLAAQSVCQIEMVGDRPYVVLLKDREKEKCKEKEKICEKDKQQTADAKTASDANAKNFKAPRKSPQSFISVIELLLDSIINFVPSSRDDGLKDRAGMDIDGNNSKGKGKAIAKISEEGESDNQEASASLAKTVFMLKLLTEILLTYSASVHILLRRDAEISSCRGVPNHGPVANFNGGLFHHILHKFLPYSGTDKKDRKVEGDWRQKLATRASQFLVAASVRSVEGRKRVFTEISNIFNDFVATCEGFRPPDCNILAYIDLINDILAARSPTGLFISAEASATFVDVGLVQSLTQTLQVLDLDHMDSPKIVTGIVKALELVTKELIQSADSNSTKGDSSAKPLSDRNQPGRAQSTADGLQSIETTSQPDRHETMSNPIEPFNRSHISGGSDSVTDDMEHDQDLDGRFALETEDDFMQVTHEEVGGLENGIASVEITFDISHGAQNNLVDEDDDEEMSGDGGDEEDEDDEDDEDGEDDEVDNDDLDEDQVHHMSPPDTDQEDHEMDEDEFDEDVLEGDEEDDDDDENGLILRLEDGINGINVLDHIEVFGRDNNFSNDALHVMPVEVFGSRRQGRTTSIYNLLGRSGDHGLPLQHPLLMEPASSTQPIPLRQSENAGGDLGFSDRNFESASSRLDVIFRSLRSGRHGHRFNIWAEENQQRGGSNVATIPQGIEELFVSQLRRPTPDQPSSDQAITTIEPQEKGETNPLQGLEEVREETIVESNLNNGSTAMQSSTANLMDGTSNDVVVRDVEAGSQESSGSGATLGESLRSLEVEIGSADGHDDGGAERVGSAMRRILGNAVSTNGRDGSLQSVSEVSQEADQSGPANEQQVNRTTDVGPLDPAFLDALPEELRAEVLSVQQSQAAQPSNAQPQSTGEIDPEFLAALPADIRAEVLAQQQAQRLHQSQELEGQPVEMDTVSIIATFPSELREEVLLTSSDAILANLTPALVAEANMLRERFAHRYHSRALFGMYPRSRRGEPSRRGVTLGSGLDRIAGPAASRRTVGSKLVEADGAPLVDSEALKAMIRILRVVQPLYKGQLQRLLLNLCAHCETRTSLVELLMDMLMLDVRGPVKALNGSTEPSFRLYGCQNCVIYSRPQFLDGVPPLVSRRVLETLTYLARNHPYVAKLLLRLGLPRPTQKSNNLDQGRGKALMLDEGDQTDRNKEDASIIMLLSLLNQPLYLRSVAHLEQLLHLLEVVIDNAESNSGSASKDSVSSSEQPSVSQNAVLDAQINDISNDGSNLGEVVKLSEIKEQSKPSSSGLNSENEAYAVLLDLPKPELRLLCSLLAREGLSDSAYALVAEVLKKLVAIAPIHCHLFITELANSMQYLSSSAMNELQRYGELEKSLLGATSTDGTAILRVLQALSALFASLNAKEKDPQLLHEKERTEAIAQVWEINTSLEPLWHELSTCIDKIESSSDAALDMSSMSGNLASTTPGTMPPLPAGTQNILPYIEAFFVTCEKLRPGQSGTTSQDFTEEATTSTGSQKSHGKVDEKQVAFVKFSEKHKKLLNAFVRQNQGLLEKSFSLMLKVPRFIDFDNKRAHFRSKIKHQHDHHHSPLRISVRRAYILEDSYNQLRLRSTQDLKGRLTVHFQGEEGIDAGGLTREWYQLLSRVIFDKGALLFTTVGNDSTFQPNPNSGYQTEHLSYFKFVGRVVAKALFDGQLLDVHFTRSFYKHILGVKVTYHDIEAIDPGYFKNLKWMLENDISDILDLTFSMDADEEKLILYERAEVTDYELIPGGRNIRVTEENKHEYVDLVAEHRLTTAIRPQINAFMEGFNELIFRDLISIFNDKELELLISGLPDIDLDDMRANTDYFGYSPASSVIKWFWEVVQSFSKEDKARLLQFVTGTSKVPLEGFRALQGISGSQKFQIHKAYGSPDHLPSAHTCFNQLDLPEYPSKQQLQERLLLAIHEANEGFGFG